MDSQTFTVTLPSNSNMGSHPSNRGSNYTVKLSAPLNFSGQTLNDDVSWEVALTSLQYTNRFYDVRETGTIFAVVEFPNVAAITVAEKSPAGTVQYSATFTAANIRNLPAAENMIMTRHVKPPGSADTSFVVFGKIAVHAGHYKEPGAVHKLIVDEFNKMFNCPRYNTQLDAVLKGADGTMRFDHLPSTNKLHMFTDKAYIVNLLGFSAKDISNGDIPPLYHLNLTGAKTPCFDAVESLYVYCDLVKAQHVGDTLAPLLEIVPVQGIPGQRVHYSVSQLSYLPVNRSFVESINIEICDEYGTHVIFPDDVENVICRLRFRRIKHTGLML
jgi:hypothetical protein